MILLEGSQTFAHLFSLRGRPNWQCALQYRNKELYENLNYNNQSYSDRKAITFFSSTMGAEGFGAAEGSSGGSPSFRLLSACETYLNLFSRSQQRNQVTKSYVTSILHFSWSPTFVSETYPQKMYRDMVLQGPSKYRKISEKIWTHLCPTLTTKSE